MPEKKEQRIYSDATDSEGFPEVTSIMEDGRPIAIRPTMAAEPGTVEVE